MDRALMDGSGKDPVCIPEPSSGTDALEEQGSAAVTNTGHPPLVTCHQRGTGRALGARMPRSCWRGCCHAGFHGDFSTWREMEMTGSASEVTERSWRPPSAVAGGTALPALQERAAGTGRSPGSLRASGSPSPYRVRVAASCPGDAEPAHHICPSLAPPGKLCPGPDPSPVLATQHSQHWSTHSGLCPRLYPQHCIPIPGGAVSPAAGHTSLHTPVCGIGAHQHSLAGWYPAPLCS